ncbi:MAG: LTA synthase family protein [Clostridia bacterium]|nr:LTA synthase family protein [Clostridia bacterium]
MKKFIDFLKTAKDIVKKYDFKKLIDSSRFDRLKKGFDNVIRERYLSLSIISSIVLNLVIEILARMSVIEGFKYIFNHPFLFLYNVFLIMMTFSLALLCKKRKFSLLLINTLWLAAGITNSVLLYYRRTPFIAADFFVLKSALKIMDVYMTKFQMVALILLFILIIVGLFMLAVKECSKRTDYRKIAVFIAVSAAVSIIPTDYIVKAKNSSVSSNITDEAYQYGFACCFLNSIFANGIKKPDTYSQAQIDNILNEIKPQSGRKNSNSKKVNPNVIFIQLESFVDPYLIPGARYSEDPVPNFRYCKDNYRSGKLGVAVYGGGTANTEFEVLTGMNIKHFGIGEYPYESVLQNQTAESIAYILKKHGYTTHALHTHTGTFYDRHEVYKNLGFDNFTPAEYMDNIEYNRLGWEKSNAFTKYAFQALQKTPEKDFLFIVTAQCHGKYPQDSTVDYDIKVSGNSSIMDIKPDLEYYVNELRDEDAWLKSFLDELENYDEPVMVVMYGDHMPSLNFPEEMLDKNEIYQTEYVIWTNYEKTHNELDLKSYDLSAYTLDLLEINDGIMTRLHQYELKNGTECEPEEKILQYDMLYGNKYVYSSGEYSEHEPADMKLGISDITISDVKIGSKYASIYGENFTPSSVVYVDGNSCDTVYVSPNRLKINVKECKNYTQLTVAQKTAELTVLGETQPYENPKAETKK